MPSFTPVSTSASSAMPYIQQQEGDTGIWGDLIGMGGALGSTAIMGSFMS
jgi:hypothetical protein